MRLSVSQRRTAVLIFVGLGEVCAAGMVVPYFVDQFDAFKGLLGLISASLFFTISLVFSKE